MLFRSDPGLRPARRAAHIDARMVDFAARLLGRIRWKRADVEDFLGRFLTTPKPEVVFSISKAFPRDIKNRSVELHPRTQLLYRGSRFFMNGETLVPRASQRKVLAMLADRRRVAGPALARAGLERLILHWRRAGFVRLARRQ